MDLILKERRRDLNVLEKEIEELRSLIAPFKESYEYKEWEEKVTERIYKQEQSITDRKQKKYKRDKIDYETGTQYLRIEQEDDFTSGLDHLNNLVLDRLVEIEEKTPELFNKREEGTPKRVGGTSKNKTHKKKGKQEGKKGEDKREQEKQVVGESSTKRIENNNSKKKEENEQGEGKVKEKEKENKGQFQEKKDDQRNTHPQNYRNHNPRYHGNNYHGQGHYEKGRDDYHRLRDQQGYGYNGGFPQRSGYWEQNYGHDRGEWRGGYEYREGYGENRGRAFQQERGYRDYEDGGRFHCYRDGFHHGSGGERWNHQDGYGDRGYRDRFEEEREGQQYEQRERREYNQEGYFLG